MYLVILSHGGITHVYSASKYTLDVACYSVKVCEWPDVNMGYIVINFYVFVTNSDIRLVGGSGPHEGRVEAYHNGTWGTVCDDDWNLQDAAVVCHQLGYINATAALGSARFGAGSGPILFSELACIGNESIITECHHLLTGVHNCSHSEDVGVVCEG